MSEDKCKVVYVLRIEDRSLVRLCPDGGNSRHLSRASRDRAGVSGPARVERARFPSVSPHIGAPTCLFDQMGDPAFLERLGLKKTYQAGRRCDVAKVSTRTCTEWGRTVPLTCREDLDDERATIVVLAARRALVRSKSDLPVSSFDTRQSLWALVSAASAAARTDGRGPAATRIRPP